MSNVVEPLQLNQVWEKYQRSLKAFLHSKVNNEADVEDLLQEILIKTHQNLSTIKDQTSVKAWLFQLAHRTIVDFYRKRARVQRDQEIDAEELWYQQEPETLEQEMAKCIAPFIQALPSENAAMLSAVELEGQSQKELAEKQGVSYSTFKSRVQKSRMELRKLFENCCELQLDTHGNVVDYHQKNKQCGC